MSLIQTITKEFKEGSSLDEWAKKYGNKLIIFVEKAHKNLGYHQDFQSQQIAHQEYHMSLGEFIND